MILDATSLSHYQMCQRRYLLETAWRSSKWRPRSLFERILRLGVTRLSSPDARDLPISALVRDLKARFLGQCASPGLDLPHGSNPFIIAKDWAMMLEMVLRTVRRSPLLTLNPVASVSLSPRVSWRLSSLADDSGTLHRWLSCDRWDRDELSRHAHGWWVFGDMAATRRNLTLHVVETGRIQNGRRDACWTRGFRHKFAPNLPLKFKRPEKNPQDMLSVYLADLSRDDPEKWVDTLIAEGVAQKHIRHVTLECPSDEVCADTVRQMTEEAERMELLSVSTPPERWSEVPMSRSACDGMVPCPWQECCYRWPQVEPEDAGYVRLDERTDTMRVIPPEMEGKACATAPASGR